MLRKHPVTSAKRDAGRNDLRMMPLESSSQRDSAQIIGNLGAFLQSAPDAMVVADSTGRIILANRQTEELFGYSSGELLGQPIELLVPHRHRFKHTHDRTRYFSRNPISRPMGAGLQLAGLRKDGTEFPVEISLSPVETPQGMVVMSAIRDVSERKAADERFRNFLESAPDATVIVDEHGWIVLVNAQTETLFGYKREELIGKPVEMLIPERYRDQHPHHRSDFAAEARVRPMGLGLELFGLRKDGTEFPVEISLSPLVTSEGTFVTSAIRDITARKEAEEQIRKLNDELEAALQRSEKLAVTGRMLATIAHEIRNPLDSLTNILFVLKSNPSLDLAGKEFVEFAEGEVARLVSIAGQTLAPHRQPKLPVVTSVAKLLDDVLATFAAKLMASKVSVHREYESDGEVTIFPSELQQVFTNLVGNAIDAMDKGGELTVGVRKYAADVVVSVADTGCGIPEENREAIFNPFFTTKGDKGTGIGLFVIKGLVNKLGGSIDLESSTEPGKCGTKFTVHLPATKAEPGEPQGPENTQKMSA
jgi:protein-histidine pros-kinase